MARSDPQWDEFVEFVRSRPAAIQRLMLIWPPYAMVRAKKDVTLLIPAPGVDGYVGSYVENGNLGIIAPTSVPHPEHGWGKDPETGEPLPPGTMLSAECKPEVLRPWKMSEWRWSRDDVLAALACS
jgi:hypothetical protein